MSYLLWEMQLILLIDIFHLDHLSMGMRGDQESRLHFALAKIPLVLDEHLLELVRLIDLWLWHLIYCSLLLNHFEL